MPSEFSGTEKERILKATSKAVEPASAVKSSANAKIAKPASSRGQTRASINAVPAPAYAPPVQAPQPPLVQQQQQQQQHSNSNLIAMATPNQHTLVQHQRQIHMPVLIHMLQATIFINQHLQLLLHLV